MEAKNFIFSFFISLFFIVTSHAQVHNWMRTNPGGGGAFSTIGASASGIIIAGSDLSGAYRSLDGGQSWDVIGADRGLTETHISGVGFHRTNGQILYIGTENGLFRSNNGGATVIKVLASGYITDIEFGTNLPHIGYASYHTYYDSPDGAVYKTTNNGLSWNLVSSNLPWGIHILKIVVDPSDADIVYILTGSGRFTCGPAEVFKSVDGGITWANITTSFYEEIMDFAIDPNTPSTLYLTTMNADCNAPYYWTDLYGELHKSTDGGTSWSYLSDYTGVIWLDPADAKIIRLIDPREPYPWNDRAGTFTSTDAGITFTQTGFVEDWDTFFNGDPYWCYGSSFNGIVKTLGEDLSDPHTYYWVTSQWGFKSTDDGTTFQNIFTDEISNGFWRSRGFDNVNMMDVAISPTNPDIVFLAYFDMGIWRSLDGGFSWQGCNHADFTGNWEGFGGNCATILVDPARSNVVWASQSENQNGEYPTYLIKNTNTGALNDWFLSNNGLPQEQIMGLSLDPNSPTHNRTLFVTALRDVYKSVDDGISWTKVFDCNGCRFTAVDQFDGNLVYAGGEAGLWRSLDGGTTWTSISHPDMLAPPNIDFWDWDYEGIFDVQTDPNNPDYLYVVVFGYDKGLYRSTDKGNSWEKLLTDHYLRKIGIVPVNSDVLYATSSSAFQAGGYEPDSKGVWFSQDGGQSWVQQNQQMAYPFAFAIAIDHSAQPTVFVGSPGTGFQKATVPLPSPTAMTSASPDHALQLLPNPVFDKCQLSCDRPIKDDPVIYDINNRVVTHQIVMHRMADNRIVLNCTALAPGTYTVVWGKYLLRWIKN